LDEEHPFAFIKGSSENISVGQGNPQSNHFHALRLPTKPSGQTDEDNTKGLYHVQAGGPFKPGFGLSGAVSIASDWLAHAFAL